MNTDPTEIQESESENRTPLWQLWLLGTYFIVLNPALVYVLLKVWPGSRCSASS
jgi:hypothetical protein